MSQLTTSPPRLGNCTNLTCQQPLCVRELPKFRMAGDQKIWLDEDGKDVPLDQRGNPTRKVATRWTVVCMDCNKEYPDHPYQQTIDEAVAKRNAAVPAAPAFMDPHQRGIDTVAVHEERQRMTATVEGRVAALESKLDKLVEMVALLTNRKKGA